MYDRFLMATSSVVRLGRGYQSDNSSRPSSRQQEHSQQTACSMSSKGHKRSRSSLFGPKWAREQLEKSTSSKSLVAPMSIDDFGARNNEYEHEHNAQDGSPRPREDITKTMTVRMRNALKALVSTPRPSTSWHARTTSKVF